jgi:type IV secretion system protein VirB5
MMQTALFRSLAMAAAISVNVHRAHAQMAVFDASSYLQIVKQLQEAKAQLDQLQQTHASFNKLTSMGDIASLLNSPQIRNALPRDFSSVQAALSGQGGNASAYRDQDVAYTPSSGAYAAEVQRIQGNNAGSKSVAEQMYNAASQRIAGIEQLRGQIGQSSDPKSTMDLQARLGVEQAAAQQDIVRMQSLAMLGQAQARVEEQRKAELFEKSVEDEIKRYRSN